MTDKQLNKRIHEIMEICWHVIDFHVLDRYFYCLLCLEEQPETKGMTNIDFVNTWEGFGILWKFIQKHEHWEKFIYYHGAKSRALHEYHFGQDCNKLCSVTDRVLVYIDIINPPALAKVVARFFEEE